MAADTISFTPIKSTLNPVPAPLVFTAAQFGILDPPFNVEKGTLKMQVDMVDVSFTDVAFTRTSGLKFKNLRVLGTDTTNLLATADAQLLIIESMEGAECEIISQDFGTFSDFVCVNANSPMIAKLPFPGFYIHYTLDFVLNP